VKKKLKHFEGGYARDHITNSWNLLVHGEKERYEVINKRTGVHIRTDKWKKELSRSGKREETEKRKCRTQDIFLEGIHVLGNKKSTQSVRWVEMSENGVGEGGFTTGAARHTTTEGQLWG